MHAGALRALEYDRIVEAVRRFAQTPPGAARLAKLQPLLDARAVAAALAATAETTRFLRDGEIGLQAPEDLDALLRSLAVEGRVLEPLSLVNLAGFLASVEATCGAVRKVRTGFPLLAAIAETAASFQHEIADIRRKIGPAYEVVDDASPELASLRDRLRKQRARLRGTLESYLRGRDTSKYLQQQIVTDRNGRYVLVVRSEHRTSIPGIVHGSSGSGASLFLEPLSTVEINNDIVALEQQEAEEVRRILLALADALRRRAWISNGRLTRRPSSTCCRRARASRCSSTGFSQRSRAMAGSSCAPPGIRCSSRRYGGIWAPMSFGIRGPGLGTRGSRTNAPRPARRESRGLMPTSHFPKPEAQSPSHEPRSRWTSSSSHQFASSS